MSLSLMCSQSHDAPPEPEKHRTAALPSGSSYQRTYPGSGLFTVPWTSPLGVSPHAVSARMARIAVRVAGIRLRGFMIGFLGVRLT